MKKSRRQADCDPTGWNLHADATIASLRKDRRRFDNAQRRLLTIRKQPNWPATATWPENVNVLRGLSNGFDRSYKVAYGENCRK